MDGGGLQVGAKHSHHGGVGWFLGAAPLNESIPTPTVTMRQDGYTMVLTIEAPAGTRLTLWRGDK